MPAAAVASVISTERSKPFARRKSLHDLGRDVNSVRDNVGGELVVGKHFAEDAGLAMIERPHGIEGVSGVAGAGLHTFAGGFQRGVGVANAHANIAPGGFRDNFDRSGKLGSDGHHAHMPARSLPETFKDFQRRARRDIPEDARRAACD